MPRVIFSQATDASCHVLGVNTKWFVLFVRICVGVVEVLVEAPKVI